MQFIIHFLPVSSCFHMDTRAFRSLLRVVNALPTVQGTCNTKAQLSSAISRITLGESVVCYNMDITLSQWLLGRQPHCAQDSALVPHRRGRKESNVVGPYIHHTTSSIRRGKRVQSLVEIGSEMWICIRYKERGTNKRTKTHFIFISNICKILWFIVLNEKCINC